MSLKESSFSSRTFVDHSAIQLYRHWASNNLAEESRRVLALSLGCAIGVHILCLLGCAELYEESLARVNGYLLGSNGSRLVFTTRKTGADSLTLLVLCRGS